MKLLAILSAAALLYAGTYAIAGELDAASLRQLTSVAEKAIVDICTTPSRGENANVHDDDFETTISTYVYAFSTDLYKAMSSEEEEVAGELKKRQFRQRPQTLGRESMMLVNMRAKPCKDLFFALRAFTKAFQQLAYAISERCDGACATPGVALDAIIKLHSVYDGQWMAGFMTLARGAQRNLGCNMQDNWLEGNAFALRRVEESLRESRPAFGLNVTPCADRK